MKPFSYFANSTLMRSSRWTHLSVRYLSVVVPLLIYLLLLAKNPFNTRSLIPNLEPYPDALYYLTPAWNFIQTGNFSMSIGDIHAVQVVPPTYSLILVPFFALFRDVRSFYFANIFLSFWSIYIFTQLLKDIVKPQTLHDYLFVGLASTALVTTPLVYLLPELPMAENASLFFLLLCIYFIFKTSKSYFKYVSYAIPPLLLLCKFSNFPVAALAATLLFVKDSIESKQKIRVVLTHICIWAGAIFLLHVTLHSFDHITDGSSVPFSLDAFLGQIRFYVSALFGVPGKMLWMQDISLFPRLIPPMCAIGAVCAICKGSHRLFALFLALCIIALVVFMSSFPGADIRYIYILTPLLYLLGALGYSTMSTRTQIFTCTYFLIATALIFTTRIGNMTPGETGYTTLKKQIMLNIKYTATPWNYIAVSSWNKVPAINQEKVYIGTFLPHFYTRFYAPDTVHYLPLTLDQEFFWRKKNHLATQYHIYDDLMTHYKKLIVSGASVYITDAYVSNSAHWGSIFKKYHDTFHMKKVSSDCLDTCSLYQLSL